MSTESKQDYYRGHRALLPLSDESSIIEKQILLARMNVLSVQESDEMSVQEFEQYWNTFVNQIKEEKREMKKNK